MKHVFLYGFRSEGLGGKGSHVNFSQSELFVDCCRPEGVFQFNTNARGKNVSGHH